MIFKNLPLDVIHYILSYSDTIKYRNGKYMNQISKTDKRYALLQLIEPIKRHHIYEYVFYIKWNLYLLYYRPTFTSFSVDLENDKVIYSFCYDCNYDPEKYHIWIRN